MKQKWQYTSMSSLTLGDLEIPSNKCAKITIQHTVDARHILLAITYLFEYNHQNNTYLRPKKLSRKIIEDKLKDILRRSGDGAFEAPIDYNEDGQEFSNFQEILPQAVEEAKRFFPEFVGTWVPKSVKFVNKVKG
jgi:hypothetical protein